MSGIRARVGVLAAVALAVVSLTGMSVAAAAPPAAPAPPAAVGIRLMDVPIDRGDDPRSRTYIVDHLAPGATISRRLQLSNTSTAPLTVSLYPGAGHIDADGFGFGTGREGNELTDWTRIDPASVTVPAGGTAVATATVAVDPHAAPGERYGVLWAELPPAAGSGITSINRVGVRMYLSVGPGGEPPADFAVARLRAVRSSQGAPLLVADVSNTGGRAVDLNGELRLGGGPGGVSAGPFGSSSQATLASGGSGQVAFALDPALPAGPWKASVTLRSGRVEKTSEATVTFPATSPSATGDHRVLLGVVGGVVVLVVLVAALWWWRRSRRGEQA